MIHLIGRHSTQTGMPSVLVIEVHPIANTLLCLSSVVVSFEIDLLVFQAAPEALNKHIVHPASLAVHADFNAMIFDDIGKALTGKLTALMLLNISGGP